MLDISLGQHQCLLFAHVIWSVGVGQVVHNRLACVHTGTGVVVAVDYLK